MELCCIARIPFVVTLGLVLLLSLSSNHIISAVPSTDRSIVSSVQHQNNTIFVSILSGDYNPFRQPISQDINEICGQKSSPSYYSCSSNYLAQLKIALENENPSSSDELTQRTIDSSQSGHGYASPELSQSVISTNNRILSEINQICGQKSSLSYYSCANAYYNGLSKKMQEQSSPLTFEWTLHYNSSFNLPFHDPPSYNPSSLTVRIGTTVEWTNHDNKIHTVTSGTNDEGPTGDFDSNNLDQGQSYKYTFNKPGIFHYFDKISKTMSGTIVVVGA